MPITRTLILVVDRPDDHRLVRLAHSVLGSADWDVDLVVVEDGCRLHRLYIASS